METLTAISTRRSIRNYDPSPIEQNIIEEIVKYGLYAPSAHNQQARMFFLISKQKDRDFLGELMEYGKMIPNAPRIILATFDETKLKSPEFIQQDMGASIQNILLSTHEKGFGAVRIGTYPHEKEMHTIKEYFKLENKIVPFALIAVGKPAQEARKKNIDPQEKIKIL